jgi:hypothetical protein
MTDWQCARCRAQVAPGAPRCPECPSTEFIKAEAGAGDVLKISRDGTVSDSADVAAPAVADETAVQEHPGTGVPMEGIEHPADGTMSPPVSNDEPPAASGPEPAPAPASPRPPRRTPPPGAQDA